MHAEVIPADFVQIVAMPSTWPDADKADLILTTGGTGVSPRDVTPEAAMKVVERLIPGIGELMRLKSLEKTPLASLSRAVAEVRGQTLLIILPGSPRCTPACCSLRRSGVTDSGFLQFNML